MASLNTNISTFDLLASPTTVNAFAGASTALSIGHASAAAAFAGGISIPTGKSVTGAGTAKIDGFSIGSVTPGAGAFTTVSATGKATANGGVTVGASSPQNEVMGFSTGSVAASGTYDFTIPTNVGGMMIVVEDGANDYALAVFNNDAGTLAVTEVMDAANELSTSGTAIRITNGHGGAATYYVTFIGRSVSTITGA